MAQNNGQWSIVNGQKPGPWSPVRVPWLLYSLFKSAVRRIPHRMPAPAYRQAGAGRQARGVSVLTGRVHVCARKRATIQGARNGTTLRPRGLKNIRKIPRPPNRAAHLRAQERNHAPADQPPPTCGQPARAIIGLMGSLKKASATNNANQEKGVRRGSLAVTKGPSFATFAALH